MNSLILITTTLFSGLMAGLFYAWSISVTPGLAQVSDQNYLHAFQSMNRAILNPAFFIPFIGQAILLPLLSYLSYRESPSHQFWYILTATLLYLIGCMVVTIFGNVPLNESLEILEIEKMTAKEMKTFRLGFENKWNQLNMARTFSTFFSMAFLAYTCFKTLYK